MVSRSSLVITMGVVIVGVVIGVAYSGGLRTQRVKEDGMRSSIATEESALSKNVEKFYCLPQGLEAAECEKQRADVEKQCETKKAQAGKNPVFAKFKLFMKECEEADRIKLLDLMPEESKFTEDLGRAVKVCELDVRSVCESWTCPTFCKMTHTKDEDMKKCLGECSEKCQNVNLIAGAITPDEDADQTGYEVLKKMQATDPDIILQAMLREHIVKCTCQRRTWDFNKDDWGDSCYMGGMGLKPGQKWCSWDALPSWQALKTESAITYPDPGQHCGVKAGVQFKVELTAFEGEAKPSPEVIGDIRRELAEAVTKAGGPAIVKDEVVFLKKEVKEEGSDLELFITNPNWEGSGEADASNVKKKLTDLFADDAEQLTAAGACKDGACAKCIEWQAQISNPQNKPQVKAAREAGDDSSGPPNRDGPTDAPTDDKSAAGPRAHVTAAVALAYSFTVALMSLASAS